ncbi:hypothetical protein [Brevibacillus nitrificans]|uniref:hypothetical protein n=1 Tax=Brevibacillus nitrificans TaxID=651560 RepID=UPI002856AD19|nr:hypothetical protein [Brevibacillus nitrificans]MDR7313784.1 hypothetical protein [Brevibacillus nitrificans]
MIYSVSVYKDKKGSLLFIPYAYDENGIGRNVNKPQTITGPKGYDQIPQKIKDCLEVSKSGSYSSSDLMVKVHEVVTGIKSYKQFSKERDSVTVDFDPKEGYTFTPNFREKDGSYGFKEETLKLGLYPDDEELVLTLMKAYEFCN